SKQAKRVGSLPVSSQSTLTPSLGASLRRAVTLGFRSPPSIRLMYAYETPLLAISRWESPSSSRRWRTRSPTPILSQTYCATLLTRIKGDSCVASGRRVTRCPGAAAADVEGPRPRRMGRRHARDTGEILTVLGFERARNPS